MFGAPLPFGAPRPFASLVAFAEPDGGSTPQTRRGPWRGAVVSIRRWSGFSEAKSAAPARSRTWRLR